MDSSITFFVKLFWIILPGVFSYWFYISLQGRAKKNNWERLIEILLIAILCYVEVYILFFILNYIGLKYTFDTFNNITNNKTIEINELLVACIFGIVNSILFSYFTKKRIIINLAQKIKITDYEGNENLWSIIIPELKGKWILFRDHKYELVYYGWIHKANFFNSEMGELYLKDVRVHSNIDGKKLYEIKELYISRILNELSIEVDKSIE